MKTQSRKAKGRRLQQKFMQLLIEKLDIDSEDIESRSMGAGGEDVQLSPAAREFFPYQVECKNLAKIAVYNYYEQAKEHGYHQPVVFIKQNQSRPLAIIDAEYFFKMVSK